MSETKYVQYACLTGFARTYLSKMTLFAQEPCQKRRFRDPKGIKFTQKISEREKKERGEGKKRLAYLLFLYRLLWGPKASKW